jgi:hypothetical protein
MLGHPYNFSYLWISHATVKGVEHSFYLTRVAHNYAGENTEEGTGRDEGVRKEAVANRKKKAERKWRNRATRKLEVEEMMK